MENDQIVKAGNTEVEVLPADGRIQTVIGNHSGELFELLMGNIKKVQAGSAAIPQAQEVRNQVREIINLAKLEVDMYRTVQNLQRQNKKNV